MFKDRLALLAAGTLLVLLSVPYALSLASPPPGLSFLGSFHDPFDTPVYLSAMRAGARGQWLRIAAKIFARLQVHRAWTHWLQFSVIIGGMILLDLYCLYRYLIPGLTSNG